jgi:hypothetical protein
MRTFAPRMPIAGIPRSTPLLLTLASIAALAAGHVLTPHLPLVTGDPTPALETWPAVIAAALGVGASLAGSRTLNGSLAAAMALGLLLAGTAALLQAAFATGFAAAILSVSGVVFLASALFALDVALTGLAPDRVLRGTLH